MQDVRVSADPPDLLGRVGHPQADLPPRHRLRLIFLHRGEGVKNLSNPPALPGTLLPRRAEMPSRPRCDGKPKFSCEECRRHFVENPSNEMIPQEAWSLAGRLLLEEISAAGIAGATETTQKNSMRRMKHHVSRNVNVF